MSRAWSRGALVLLFVLNIACGGGEGSPDGATCADGCNDSLACTRDECVAGACVHTYDEALCCTSDQCDIEGACFENEAPNPDNSCQICLVAESGGEWSTAGSVTCDDSNPCTMNDACVGGECRGEAYECEDGNPCTDNVCGGDGSCEYVNNTGPCTDNDACTVEDTCDAGACVPGEAANCDDENTCTADSCVPESGCQNEPAVDGTSCDDADMCSPTSECRAGACEAVGASTCEDNNICTVDSCNADSGECRHNDISNLCVDTNPCTDDSCDPEQGCVFGFNTNSCNDNSLCTLVDACSNGICTGTPVNIDDSNFCTDDACNPLTGVSHMPNTLPCDDANACTVGDRCASGGCVPGTTPLDCDDESVCTDDSCDPASGCANIDNSARCNDGNACTADVCDPVDGCSSTVIQSFACLPNIEVTSPARAATIDGVLPSVVVVTGRVTSGAGAITSFTINGTTVAVNPTTGAFTYNMISHVGSNVIVLEAQDALGSTDKVVQSFHWSTDYTQPTGAPASGVVDPGLGIWLGQQSLDDGQPPPPTDLAFIIQGVLDNFDLGGLLPNPVATNLDGGAAGTYNVYLENLQWEPTSVSLDAIDGGLHITATIPNLTADLRAVKTCTWRWYDPFDCVGPGTITGDITIDYITMDADIFLSVAADHTLVATVANTNVSIAEPDVNIDGILAFIIEPIIQDQVAGFVPELEAQFEGQLSSVVGPLLEDGLGALAFNQTFDLPRLDGSTPGISVALASDFSSVDFHDGLAPPTPTPPQGGAFLLRAWANAVTPGLPSTPPFTTNLGVPMRVACGAGTQQMIIPRVAPVEIVFPDDTMNQILRGAWSGGLLQFPVDPALLAGVDLASYGVTNLTIDVSGWLPPIASDCGADGILRLYIGDMQLTASMDLFGQPLDAVIWVSFDAPITLGANATSGEIEIVVSAVENVEIEVNVQQEQMLSAGPVLASLLETQLVPALGGLLGGGAPLASFPLPEMDLSASLGQPPGTSVIAIQPLAMTPAPPRQAGNTIIYGSLR